MYLEELCWKLYLWPMLAHLAHLKGICFNLIKHNSTPFPYITLPVGATFPTTATTPSFTFPTILTLPTIPPTPLPTFGPTIPPATIQTIPPTPNPTFIPTIPTVVTAPTVNPTFIPTIPTVVTLPPPPTINPTFIPTVPTQLPTFPTLPPPITLPTLTPVPPTIPPITIPTIGTIPTIPTLPTVSPSLPTVPSVPPITPSTSSPITPLPTFPTFLTSIPVTPPGICPDVPVLCPNGLPLVPSPTFQPTTASTPGGIDPRPGTGILRQGLLPNGCPCIDPRTSAIGLLFNAFALAENCYSPDNLPGFCLNIENCGYFLQLAQNISKNRLFSLGMFIKRSLCGYDGFDLLVCCPALFSLMSATTTATIVQASSSPQSSSLIFNSLAPTFEPAYIEQNTQPTTNVQPSSPIQYCGISNFTQTRVVGGGPAQLGQYPWMTALGYRASSQIPQFYCGGSLVTLKHVLTSAHCINDNLYLVRLGEYDLSSDMDGAYPIDVPIDLKIVHEQYVANVILNDIALLRLRNQITITDQIRPICLPFDEPLRSRDLTGYQPFIAGWGATTFQGPVSKILQEAQIPVVSLSDCQRNYNTLFPGQVFDNRVLCAGYGGRDTCQGDSGGPLMLPQVIPDGTYFYFVLIGIVSYGYECAKDEFPGVYTRVSTYIPWIQQHIND